MKVLAEGVEEKHQLEAIQRLGFDAVQGFYRGKPQPASDVRSFLRRMTTPPPRHDPCRCRHENLQGARRAGGFTFGRRSGVIRS